MNAGNGPPDDRARKKPTTKVKVVASRYALALKKSNQEQTSRSLESQAAAVDAPASMSANNRKQAAATHARTSALAQGSRSPLTSDSSLRISGLAASSSAPRRAAASTLGPQNPSATTLTRGSKRHLADAALGSAEPGRGSAHEAVSAPDASQDMRARLEAYRASKQHRTRQDATHVHANSAPVAASSTSSHGKRGRRATSESRASSSTRMVSSPRPSFPKRIASVERSGKQSTPLVSPAASTHTNASLKSAKLAGAAQTISKAPPTGHHNTSEELELLESLYYQLCFVEAKGEATFARQEETAQQQMIGAWEVLRSKLQLLHDTSLRFEKEQHTANLEAHLALQADPITEVATSLPPLLDSLTRMCSSLASALNRMPTPGIICIPDELKRHMDALTVSLGGVLEQLTCSRLDASVSSAVQFERAMCEASNKVKASLMQLAHLLEEIHAELDTETSVAIQKIQQLRIDSVGAAEAPSNSFVQARVPTRNPSGKSN